MAPPTVYPGHFDTTSLISVICATLATYNALELILLILTTFKSYHGLYFWSMVIATTGIVPYVIGMELMYFDASAKLGALIINNLGWIAMVVAQSVVLYSRLGIVLGSQNSRILLFTKWMIIINAIVFYTLATTIVFGMHYSRDWNYDEGYIYSERIQMTGFCAQEFIISGLYIWKSLDILKAGERKQARRTLWQLFVINVVIVGLDIGLLVLEYLSLATIEISFKALAYSVKLKMEFAILSKLLDASSLTQRKLSVTFNNQIALGNDILQPVQRVPTSSHFMASTLTSPESEKDSKPEHVEYKVNNPARLQSHQTDRSDTELCRIKSATQPSSRATDPYHDIIRDV